MATLIELMDTSAAQHGLVTRTELLAAGIAPATLARAVERGHLVRVQRGVFRCVGVPATWEQAVLAACLSSEGTVASHRSAARLWDVWVPENDLVEVTITRPHTPRPCGAICHRSTDLDRDLPAVRSGIPVTSPPRTILDLGAVVSERVVERALETMIARRLVTPLEVRGCLERTARRGRRGAGAARRILDRRSVGGVQTDSVVEVFAANICRDYGLPVPVAQYEVWVGGRPRRLDLAYPDLRIAIEIDGFAFHSGREAFQEDRIRQNDLLLAGWTVLRFTFDDVMRRPSYVANVIRAAIERAAR